jgi:hypothetical protein
MSIVKSITKSKLGGYLLLGAAGVAGLIVLSSALTAAINQAVGSNSDKSDGASGSDGTSRIDPASSSGVAGVTAHGAPTTLQVVESTVDGLFGGGLSRFGGWVGNRIFAPTSAAGGPGDGGSLNISNYNQTNNPYAGGQTTLYADAVDESPTPAAGSPFASVFSGAAGANPNAQSPTGPSPADQIVWN